MFPIRKTLALGAMLAAGSYMAACKSDKKTDPLAQDSSLTRDLALANQGDSAMQPQLKDVPATPPPVAPKPSVARPVERPKPVRAAPPPKRVPPPPPVARAPAPVVTPSGNRVEERAPSNNGASEGHVGTVATGTNFALLAGQRVCTNTNTPGDRFTATLADPITATNGVTIPAGATAVVEVTNVKQSAQDGDNMQIGLVVRSIAYGGKTYPVNGEITGAEMEKVRSQDNNDAAKVLGGAAIGAVLGRVFGGKNKTKGTIIGGAAGGAAGAVLASKTAKYDACIPSGSRITVRLNAPMQIQAASASGTMSPGI